ncbi:MAG: helix-turn-helix domain-containing protein [Marinilabiliaceae bacterium]|nr:helix-turn-helix domain-containing protein [Marinilabiliaceae bacterium]
MALRSDVSQSIISSLESDKSIPNSVMLRRIAEVLDVDINELLKEDFINQNIFDKGIGNIQSQVTINNFPENILEDIISNQQKIFTMMESQNKLLESLLKK